MPKCFFLFWVAWDTGGTLPENNLRQGATNNDDHRYHDGVVQHNCDEAVTLVEVER